MGRTAIKLVLAAVVVSLIVSLSALGVAQPTDGLTEDGIQDRIATDTTSDESDNESGLAKSGPRPGAQFAGVVGAHRKRHSGAVEEQTIPIRLASADSPKAKAATIAAIHLRNARRLDELAQRRSELINKHQRGVIPENEYRVRLATLDAEIRSVEQVAIRLDGAVDGVPASHLLGAGIEREAIRNLRSRAHSLQGPQLPAIAPSFAREGNASQADPPVSPSEQRATETETVTETATEGSGGETVDTALATAETDVETAHDRVDRANQTLGEPIVSETAASLLDRAQRNLTIAEQKLADARDAREAGETQRAIELASQASHYAQLAIEQSAAAIEEATTGGDL